MREQKGPARESRAFFIAVVEMRVLRCLFVDDSGTVQVIWTRHRGNTE